jgi:hypothetical protein
MMLPRAAMYNFAWDFFDEHKLDTVNDVLDKLPEFYTYLQSASVLPQQMTLEQFEKGISQGWQIAQQEYNNPQARFFRDLKRQGGFR